LGIVRPTPSYRVSPTALGVTQHSQNDSQVPVTTTIPHLRTVMGLDRDPRRYSRLTNAVSQHGNHHRRTGHGSRGGSNYFEHPDITEADPRTSRSNSAFSTPYSTPPVEESSYSLPNRSASSKRRRQYQSMASENYNHTNRHEHPSSTKRSRHRVGGMRGSKGRRSRKKSSRNTTGRGTIIATTPVSSNGVGQRILDILGEMSAPMDHARREWNISPVPFTSSASSNNKSSSSNQHMNTATKKAVESDIILEFGTKTPQRNVTNDSLTNDSMNSSINAKVEVDLSNFNPSKDSKLMPPPAPRTVSFATPQQRSILESDKISANFSANSLYSNTAQKAINQSNGKATLPSLFGPESGSKVDASVLYNWSPEGSDIMNDKNLSNDSENQFWGSSK
jgi:hypothetical protein